MDETVHRNIQSIKMDNYIILYLDLWISSNIIQLLPPYIPFNCSSTQTFERIRVPLTKLFGMILDMSAMMKCRTCLLGIYRSLMVSQKHTRKKMCLLYCTNLQLEFVLVWMRHSARNYRLVNTNRIAIKVCYSSRHPDDIIWWYDDMKFIWKWKIQTERVLVVHTVCILFQRRFLWKVVICHQRTGRKSSAVFQLNNWMTYQKMRKVRKWHWNAERRNAY